MSPPMGRGLASKSEKIPPRFARTIDDIVRTYLLHHLCPGRGAVGGNFDRCITHVHHWLIAKILSFSTPCMHVYVGSRMTIGNSRAGLTNLRFLLFSRFRRRGWGLVTKFLYVGKQVLVTATHTFPLTSDFFLAVSACLIPLVTQGEYSVNG